MDENDLIYSEHCQSFAKEGKTVRVRIYSSGRDDWILEVVDERGTSTVWDEPFRTDDEAFIEFQRTLLTEGIDAMIGAPDRE